MKTRITRLALVGFLSLTLAACASGKDYEGNIAMVDNVAISNDAYTKQLDFYQKYYSKKYGEDYLEAEVERGKTRNDVLKDELIDSMIKDQVMVNDLKANDIKVDDSKATSLRNDLESKLGGKDSLKANITAMDLSENDFNENLYKDSIRKIHYDYFLSHNDIKDSEILEFYKANELYQRQYKYNILVFDDEKEANKVKEAVKTNMDFTKLLKEPVKNYEIINSDFVYGNDPLLTKAAVTELGEVSPVFEDEGKYMILMVNSYNDNENDLLINVKDIYLKDKYEDYLNKLVKKSKIRLFV